jgi:hypothetical protein
MMQPIALWTARLLVIVIALLPGRPGVAAPLSPEACAAIETEHAALAATGLPEIVKGGPNHGPDSAAKAKEVARYIHLREQFLFRCGHDKKRATPAGAEGEAAVAPGAEKAAPVAPPPPKRKPAPARPAAQAAKPATDAPEKPKARTTSAPAKPAPKTRPKPDDAYRPPPKEPVKSP